MIGGPGKVFAVAEPAAAVDLDRLEADMRAVWRTARPAEIIVESVIEEDPSAYLGRVCVRA